LRALAAGPLRYLRRAQSDAPVARPPSASRTPSTSCACLGSSRCVSYCVGADANGQRQSPLRRLRARLCVNTGGFLARSAARPYRLRSSGGNYSSLLPIGCTLSSNRGTTEGASPNSPPPRAGSRRPYPSCCRSRQDLNTDLSGFSRTQKRLFEPCARKSRERHWDGLADRSPLTVAFPTCVRDRGREKP
jgi:hypothetical protein